jgi:hypothetical protein
MNDLLPILDLSGYRIYQPPGEPFVVLDPPSDEQEPSGAQDGALHKLLGIQALLEALATVSRTLTLEAVPYFRVFKQLLAPVGKTAEGALVAVALHLVGRAEHYSFRWIGFICQPEHYEALARAIQAKSQEIYHDLEEDLDSPPGNQIGGELEVNE